jgi:hypothetical protein
MGGREGGPFQMQVPGMERGGTGAKGRAGTGGGKGTGEEGRAASPSCAGTGEGKGMGAEGHAGTGGGKGSAGHVGAGGGSAVANVGGAGGIRGKEPGTARGGTNAGGPGGKGPGTPTKGRANWARAFAATDSASGLACLPDHSPVTPSMGPHRCAEGHTGTGGGKGSTGHGRRCRCS